MSALGFGKTLALLESHWKGLPLLLRPESCVETLIWRRGDGDLLVPLAFPEMSRSTALRLSLAAGEPDAETPDWRRVDFLRGGVMTF